MDYKIYSVYLIKDSRNLPYIGITENIKKRKYDHIRSGRFLLDDFSFDVIYQSKDYGHIQDMEEYFVKEYDSFKNGLNETRSGKGCHHNSKTFTTKGFKYSTESKKLMSEKAKKRIESGIHPFCNKQKIWTIEDGRKISVSYKGKIFKQKMSNYDVLEIKKLYKLRPHLNLESKKPKFKTYDGAFVCLYAKTFNVSGTTIRSIIDNKHYTKTNIKKSAKLSLLEAGIIRKNYGVIDLSSLMKQKQLRPYDRIFSEVIAKRYGVTDIFIYNIITGKTFSNIKVNLDKKILTPNGYEKFDGIVKNKHLKYYQIVLSDLTIIKCSIDHRFLTSNGDFKTVSDIDKHDSLYTGIGDELTILSIQLIEEPIELYDIINAGKTFSYYSNGIVSHNCEFVSTKGTLINSSMLEKMRPLDPIDKHGDLEIFKNIKGKRVGISIDVGTGTGQDYSVMQIFDIDALEQLAQYRNNSLTLTEFTIEIINTLTYVKNTLGATEIYYTVESNAIGQGVLTLIENSRNPILREVEFVSDSNKHSGMQTNVKTKMQGALKFKDLVESGRMKLYSRKLLSELRFFVKSGSSFKAETGMNDDLVMATIIFVNMLMIIADYDEDIFNKVSKTGLDIDLEGDTDPIPIAF